jgi:hypothetical protein
MQIGRISHSEKNICLITVLDSELLCGRAEQEWLAYALYVYQYITIGQSGEHIHPFVLFSFSLLKNLCVPQLCVLL